jgi:DnaK suppressor protein
MNKKSVERFKNQLIELRLELHGMQEAHKHSGKTVQLDQTRVGRISRMDAMQAQQMALESARRCQQQLQEIEGALRRIESDEYGYCFSCGEEIVVARLQANPACTRCVTCAE